MGTMLGILLAWALLASGVAIAIDYIVKPSGLHMGLIATFLGACTLPVPIGAKMTVAPAPMTWRNNWRAIFKQTILLSLISIHGGMQVLTFVMDRFWLSQSYHHDFVRQLVRPLLLTFLRSVLIFHVFVEPYNRIGSPE